jgi:hypothetical protein
MKMTWIPIVIGGMLLQPLAFADVSYQETTQITGGSLQGMLKMAGAFSSQAKQANAPITSTVALHGNRMVRSNPHSTEIIDLDQQNMTFIDHDKHTYSVVTFQQMQQAMADAAAKAKAQSKNSTSSDNSSDAQMSFSAHVSSSGATRNIDGRDAKEALLTVTMIANATDGSNAKGGMAATSEMWLISDVPGVEELRAFNQRMAKELAMDTSASQISGLLSAQPGGAQALADLKKEATKMSGFPVLQVTRVGVSADGQPLAAPSVAPMAHTQGGGGSGAGTVTGEVATDTGTQVASDQIGKLGSFGRALGGSSMGALMRHKPSNSANTSAPAANSGGDAATAGVLLESQTETGNFSTAPVDPNGFQIPAGYKEVASPMVRH